MWEVILPLGTEVLRLINRSSAPVRRWLVPIILTVSIQCSLYAGWHILQKGSIMEGLREAFQGEATRALTRAQRMQSELASVAQSDRQIHAFLGAVLDHAPGAARVRLSVIHNGVSGVTGIGMLRFDVTHFVAAPGRDGGLMASNQPLSEWTDYLGTLLSNQCAFMRTTEVHNLVARLRMEDLGMQAFLVCPVRNGLDMTLGALSVSWDHADALPDPAGQVAIIETMRRAAVQIAVALDMRTVTPP